MTQTAKNMTSNEESGPRRLTVALERLVTIVSRRLAFEDVTVNLCHPDGGFEVVVDTRGELVGGRTDRELWSELLLEEHRSGDTYLVPPEHVREVLGRHPEDASSVPNLPPAAGHDDWDPYHMLVAPIHGSNGEVLGYLSLDRPLSGKLPDAELRSDVEVFAQQVALAIEQAELLEDLHRSQERFSSLVRNASDIIAILEPDGSTRYISPAVERVLGYSPEEREGRTAFELVHPEDLDRVLAAFEQVVSQPGLTRTVELRMRRCDGSWRDVEATGTNLLDDSGVRGIVVNYRDITERKGLERELERRANHDPLTGLPNRSVFMDRLERALAPGGLGLTAVLFVDLDDFKAVNDSRGHDAGDRLLVEVARRLEECVRGAGGGGRAVVSRLGGDEFTVLLESVGRWSEVGAVAERVIERIGEPVMLDRRPIRVTASVGIALGRPGQCQGEALVRASDHAMYAAKRNGKSRYSFAESVDRPQPVV